MTMKKKRMTTMTNVNDLRTIDLLVRITPADNITDTWSVWQGEYYNEALTELVDRMQIAGMAVSDQWKELLIGGNNE